MLLPVPVGSGKAAGRFLREELSAVFVFRLKELLKGYVYLPYLTVVVVCWVVFFLFMPETKNRTFDEVARDLAFGTIVVGKRTAALQAPVFTKEDEEAAIALRRTDDDSKVGA